MDSKCAICLQPTQRKCSACKLVFYCGVAHQKEDWTKHKPSCKPYEIIQTEDLGRCLVATRDLEKGDVIFKDKPLLFGPPPHFVPQDGLVPCIGCCLLIETNASARCPECSWPCCQVNCFGLKAKFLHGIECALLRLVVPRYDVILVLRALLLKGCNKKKWDEIMSLQSHFELRGPTTEIYKETDEKASFILAILSSEKSEEARVEIHELYGILDVNATELQENAAAEVLYPLTSLLEHNCVPNTVQKIDLKDKVRMTLRSGGKILKGQHLSTMYTHILWGSYARRQHLQETKYFWCTCTRCADPTELQTFFSALQCHSQPDNLTPCRGIQLPINPLDSETQWKCSSCNILLPNRDVQDFINHLSDEVDLRRSGSQDLSSFLDKLLIFLHPNHYLVYSLKHSLVQLVNKQETSLAILGKNLEMIEDLISLTRTLDPCNSRLNIYLAVLLNEKFHAKFTILNKNWTKDEFEELKELLDETLSLLENESQDSGLRLQEVVAGKMASLVELI